MKTYSEILKDRRIELKISQHTLAEYIGFEHRSSIHRLERGIIQWKLRDVLKACELLKLNLTITKL